MDDTLTSAQAYDAMFDFLERLYEQTHSDELGVLLGSMSMLSNGKTADPAILTDWERSVAKAKAGNVKSMFELL